MKTLISVLLLSVIAMGCAHNSVQDQPVSTAQPVVTQLRSAWVTSNMLQREIIGVIVCDPTGAPVITVQTGIGQLDTVPIASTLKHASDPLICGTWHTHPDAVGYAEHPSDTDLDAWEMLAPVWQLHMVASKSGVWVYVNGHMALCSYTVDDCQDVF